MQMWVPGSNSKTKGHSTHCNINVLPFFPISQLVIAFLLPFHVLLSGNLPPLPFSPYPSLLWSSESVKREAHPQLATQRACLGEASLGENTAACHRHRWASPTRHNLCPTGVQDGSSHYVGWGEEVWARALGKGAGGWEGPLEAKAQCPAQWHTILSHWTSLIKHKFKDKIIKNFKMATTQH
jgi:hypothetical protein